MNWVRMCGVSTLTKKVLWREVFNYSGIHSSLFEAVTTDINNIIFWGALIGEAITIGSFFAPIMLKH